MTTKITPGLEPGVNKTSSAESIAPPSLPPPVPPPQDGQAAEQALAKENEHVKQKQATELVALATESGCELYTDLNDESYVTTPVISHKENYRLSSRAFKRWLRAEYLKQYNRTPSQTAMTEALDTLDALAASGGIKHKVFVRVAHVDNDIFIDLCDSDWRAIKVTSDGWAIVTDHQVRFLRPKGMLALPEPERGGSLEDLRKFINAPDDSLFKPIVAWLIGAFSYGPYPALVVEGEQGSCKSSLCKFLRLLVDPADTLLSVPPREARDLVIAGKNSWVVAFDNLSGLSPWLSDLLCGFSTGTAMRVRQLFTDDEEILFRAQRPVLLNGIDAIATRPDLLDRALVINLPAVPEANRKAEKTLQADFMKSQPRILGAILDALVVALANLPNTTLTSAPRMADFALWVTAAEPALGWEPGSFMTAYSANRSEAVEIGLESDSFAVALRCLMNKRDQWTGSWKDLIKRLVIESREEKAPKDWPVSGKGMSNRLRRLAPALRHVGIEYEHVREGDSRRYRINHRVMDQSGECGDVAKQSTGYVSRLPHWGDESGELPDQSGRSRDKRSKKLGLPLLRPSSATFQNQCGDTKKPTGGAFATSPLKPLPSLIYGDAEVVEV